MPLHELASMFLELTEIQFVGIHDLSHHFLGIGRTLVDVETMEIPGCILINKIGKEAVRVHRLRGSRGGFLKAGSCNASAPADAFTAIGFTGVKRFALAI